MGLKNDQFIQDVTCEEFYKKQWIATALSNTNIYEKVNCELILNSMCVI